MSEVMDQAVIGMPYEMALGCEVSRRQYYSRANAVLAERDALAAKLAMLEDAAAKGDAARQQCGGMEMEIEELRAELAELRARVAVVPDASTVYAALDARERLFTSPENIQVALEAQSRLNVLTVSEDLLRRVTAAPDYEEIFTMARGEALTELLDLLNQDKENGEHAA